MKDRQHITRFILSSLAISIWAVTGLSQASKKHTGVPKKRSAISGRSLGTYKGSASDLLPQNVGAFEKGGIIMSSHGDKTGLGNTARLEALYKTSDGKALIVVVITFSSIERTNEAIKKVGPEPRNPAPCSGFKQEISRVRGEVIVGKRITYECRGGTTVQWNNGSVLWSNGSVFFVIANLNENQKFRPVSFDDLLKFEKAFPY